MSLIEVWRNEYVDTSIVLDLYCLILSGEYAAKVEKGKKSELISE